jgi:hypothetical protein
MWNKCIWGESIYRVVRGWFIISELPLTSRQSCWVQGHRVIIVIHNLQVFPERTKPWLTCVLAFATLPNAFDSSLRKQGFPSSWSLPWLGLRGPPLTMPLSWALASFGPSLRPRLRYYAKHMKRNLGWLIRRSLTRVNRKPNESFAIIIS